MNENKRGNKEMNERCGKTLKMQQKFIEQFKKLFTEDGYFIETEGGTLKPSEQYEKKIRWENENKHIKIIANSVEVDYYGVNFVSLYPLFSGVLLEFIVSGNDCFESTKQTLGLQLEGIISFFIFCGGEELSRKGILCVRQNNTSSNDKEKWRDFLEEDFVSIPDDIIKVSSWYNQRVNPTLRNNEG